MHEWSVGQRQSQQSPAPVHPGQRSVQAQALLKEHVRQVGRGRETPFIWMRSTGHSPESDGQGADPHHHGHPGLRLPALGVPARLGPVLLRHCPPGLPPRGTEGRRAGPPPHTLHPPSPSRRCRSESWLAPGNWPVPSPQNSADIPDASKWVNKV